MRSLYLVSCCLLIGESVAKGAKAVPSGKKGSWGLSWLLLSVPKDQPGTDSMSLPHVNDQPPPCPAALEDLRRQLHQRLDQAIDACQNDYLRSSFLDFEKALLPQLSALGLLLLQLFLLVR